MIDDDLLIELAQQYGQQCLLEKRLASQTAFSHFCGKCGSWFRSSPGRRRDLVFREWTKLGLGLSPAGDRRRPKAQPEFPAGYPVGDDLLGILNHPGRLRMFCNLAQSGGIETALRYSQLTFQRIYGDQDEQNQPS